MTSHMDQNDLLRAGLLPHDAEEGCEPWTPPPVDEQAPAAPHEDPDERPTRAQRVIRLHAAELPRIIRESFAALAEQDENLYQRSGALVTIAKEPEREEPYTCDERIGSRVRVRPGTPRIVTL
jgi:hypothetical protein